MKKFKFLVGAVALFALVVANVWNAATTLQETELSLADVEALAQMEEDECFYLNEMGGNCPSADWVEVYSCYDRGMSSYYHYEECRQDVAYPTRCCPIGSTRAWAITVGIA